MSRTRGRSRLSLAVAVLLAATLSGCGSGLIGTGGGTAAPPLPTSVSPPTSPTSTPSRTAPATSGPLPTTPRPTTAPPRTPTQPPTQTPAQTPAQAPAQTPAQAPTQALTQPPTQRPTQTPSRSPTQTPTRTSLQYGDRGERVLELQQRLSELGYWLGKPDGHFGGLTQQAVFALQKAAGITRDGIVGPQTKAALAAGARPGARVGGTGVEIDLSRQLLLIVRDGAVVRILNTSTGNGERYVSGGTEKVARTPTGSFRVYRMVDALEEAELGELYRPAYYDRGFAVHGSRSIPPWPASHGCARVSNSAMDSIWAGGLMTVGTPVNVYR